MTEQERMERAKKAHKKRMQRKRQLRRRILFGMALFIVLICGLILFSCSKRDNDEKDSQTNKTQNKVENQEQAEKEEPEVYQEPEVSLIMVGDILLHDNVQESGKLSDGTYNYEHMFKHVKEDVQAADIAIANQEVVLGGAEIGL